MNNPVKTIGDEASKLAHEATLGAEHAIQSTQRAAQHRLDRMADGLDEARAQTTTALNHLVHDTESLAHRGMEAAREGSHQLRDKTVHARDVTTRYIQHEPVKSMLMAAAVGAALMGLVAIFSRHSGSVR
ncbi:hypothetical protein [Hydrogenophaga sp. PAMC20947]|uniref:hypothetical protein n=1 Tax=Hydrogenophaga sp. PAMC20947 TaxID=2565558 RepID=UPI00109DD986|nr:hypothetical protein [Hydrogenophaga sp. PAMC20947]QCB45575.1 hypothetical protein E5678_05780 [Hydrogenophaga sp. PAMC20947]